MALISASLALSFHMGSDILLLLHPLHLVGGVLGARWVVQPAQTERACQTPVPSHINCIINIA